MSLRPPKNEKASTWLVALRNGDWRARERTVSEIISTPANQRHVLCGELVDVLLRDEDPGVQNAALAAAVALGAKMLQPIEAALPMAETAAQKKLLLTALSGCATEARATLARYSVSSQVLPVRIAALEALASADGEIDAALLAALGDEDAWVQSAALESLFRRRHELSLRDIERLMRNPMLRYSAIRFFVFAHTLDTAAAWLRTLQMDPSATWVDACVDAVVTNNVILRGLLKCDLPPHAVSHPKLTVALAGARREESRSSRNPSSIHDEVTQTRESAIAMENIRAMVAVHAGLKLAESSWPMVSRRVIERMEQCGLSDLNRYATFLGSARGQREEMPRLIERLVTQETYFFRGASQLYSFRDEFLPSVPAHEPMIWSAGCATGEEAYTLAMLASKANVGPRRAARVLGTDISEAGLSIARAGVYGPRSFREGALVDEDFFERLDGERRSVREEFRALCDFQHHNLLSGRAPDGFANVDAIFCRNVLIYFSLETRRKVVRLFFETLRVGGVLFLGHSESLLHISTDFELVHFKNDMAYRKGPSEKRFS